MADLDELLYFGPEDADAVDNTATVSTFGESVPTRPYGGSQSSEIHFSPKGRSLPSVAILADTAGISTVFAHHFIRQHINSGHSETIETRRCLADKIIEC